MGRKKNIEEQLRDAILSAPMTCYALAKASGVSQGVISHFVNGNRSITMETAAKLADILELDLTGRKRPRKGR
jgi:plasmid maintenance system antidote protein VapI